MIVGYNLFIYGSVFVKKFYTFYTLSMVDKKQEVGITPQIKETLQKSKMSF